MKTSGVEFYAMSRGRWNWRVRHSNGKIAAQGEPNGFEDRRGAYNAHRRAVNSILEARRVRVIERGEK